MTTSARPARCAGPWTRKSWRERWRSSSRRLFLTFTRDRSFARFTTRRKEGRKKEKKGGREKKKKKIQKIVESAERMREREGATHPEYWPSWRESGTIYTSAPPRLHDRRLWRPACVPCRLFPYSIPFPSSRMCATRGSGVGPGDKQTPTH